MTASGGVEGYACLTDRVGWVALPRDVLVCRGSDTVKFLHSLMSQDVAAIPVGDAQWSFLLQPTGKAVALFRVHRLADAANSDGAVVLELDPGAGAVVQAALLRFRIRTACDIELRSAEMVAVRGPASSGVLVGLLGDVGVSVEGFLAGETGLRAPAGPWWRPEEFDVVAVARESGASAAAERVAWRDHVSSLPEVDAEVFDAMRIERGVPVFGREITDATIPNETGLIAAAVSRTKGCYLGQELVERIDSRGGNTPQHLRCLELRHELVPTDGRAVLSVDGKDQGLLTSAARHPASGKVVALGSVHRSVAVGAEMAVRWDGGTDSALVQRVPGLE